MFKKLKEKLNNWTKKTSKEIKDSEKVDLKEKNLSKDVNEQSKGKKIGKGLEDYSLKDSKKKQRAKKIKISQKFLNKNLEELEFVLLENNFALEVVDEIIRKLKERILEESFSKKDIEDKMKKILKDILEDILISPFDLIKRIKNQNKKPFVILFCGINGSGKTTTIAKVGKMLKDSGLSCVFACADTFRAAAREQLEFHGKKLGIKVISHEYGSDPASVGFDAIKYSEKNKIDCVLIDTAGRMYTEKNLLREIEKISKVCKPDLKIFVGESITGNDSILQAKTFDESIGIDGIILSKSDIDEKGGTALSLNYAIKKPIIYLGTGQNYEDLESFNKKKFLKKLGL